MSSIYIFFQNSFYAHTCRVLNLLKNKEFFKSGWKCFAFYRIGKVVRKRSFVVSIGIWWCILSNTLWVWFMFWRPQFKASSLPFNELLKGILSLKLSGWFNMRESETWLHYSLWHDGQDHVVDHWWSWPEEEEKPSIGMYVLYFFLHSWSFMLLMSIVYSFE